MKSHSKTKKIYAVFLLIVSLIVSQVGPGLPVQITKAAENSKDFTISNGVLTDYSGTKATVKIPQGVTKIADRAFSRAYNVESIIMPDSVTDIESDAFSYCWGLTTVTFSKNLSYLGDAAFFDCKNLQEVDLSNTRITVINNKTFDDCGKLTRVRLCDGIKGIGDDAFHHCYHLGKINLPEGVLTIGDNAFYACQSLTKLNLPSTVTSIGEHAFAFCESLQSMKIPAGVATLSEGLFQKDYNLEKLYLPDTLKVINDDALQTEDDTFDRFERLADIYLPASIDAVHPDGICGSKSALTKKFHCVGGSEKRDCVQQLKARKEQEKSIFIQEPYNATITFDANGGNVAKTSKKGLIGQMYGQLPEPKLKDYTFVGWYSDKKLTRKVDCLSLIEDSAVTLHARWKKKKNTNESSEESDFVIKDGVLKQYTGNRSVVVIPDSVTSIDKSVFKENLRVTKVVMSNRVTAVGNSAFQDCKNLRELVLSNQLTTIPRSMCEGCSSLDNVELPSSVKILDNKAFYGCSTLHRIPLGDSLERIGQYCFDGCINLLNLDLPKSVTAIDKNAFSNCKSLRSIAIPGSVEKLSEFLFKGDYQLKTVALKDGLKEIERSVFEDCIQMTSLYVPASVETIDGKAFLRGASDLTLYAEENSAAKDCYEAMSVDHRFSKVKLHFVTLSPGETMSFDIDIPKEDNIMEAQGSPVLQPDDSKFEEPTSYIDISTAAQLSSIRDNLDGNYRLTKDIDLSQVSAIGGELDLDGYGWRPIGAGADGSSQTFTGTFDGNGHTIKGLTITEAAPYKHTGLFAKIEDGSVRDLNLEDCRITVKTNPYFVGALAGLVKQDAEHYISHISHVNVSGKVIYYGTKNTVGKNIAIGGIVGAASNAVLSDCHNSAKVTYLTTEQEKPSSAYSRFIGGIAGYIEFSKVNRCSNQNTISGYRKYYGRFTDEESSDIIDYILSGKTVTQIVGGICGMSRDDSEINECYNSGIVQTYLYNLFTMTLIVGARSHSMAGGITGGMVSTSSVYNSYNTGRVYSASFNDTTLIGLFGEDIDGAVSDVMKYLDSITAKPANLNVASYAAGICGYSLSPVSGPISHCYNKGDVVGGKGQTYGIANGDVPTYYCRYQTNKYTKKGSSKYDDSVTYCMPMSSEEMVDTDTYRLFDFNKVWVFSEDNGMSSPELLNNLQSKITTLQFVSSQPTKTKYQYGEELDLSGIVLSLQLEGMKRPVELTADPSWASGYDAYTSGTQLVTVSKLGKSIDFTVEVGKNPSSGVTPGTPPAATPSTLPAPSKTPEESPAPTQTPASSDKKKLKTIKISNVKAQKGKKIITGKVSSKLATVKIKVGKDSYKKAKMKGKKFTLKTKKLKKGIKIKIKALQKGYQTIVKTYRVK